MKYNNKCNNNFLFALFYFTSVKNLFLKFFLWFFLIFVDICMKLHETLLTLDVWINSWTNSSVI